jgi:hypothetical protein
MPVNHSVSAHHSAEPAPRRQHSQTDPYAIVTFGATGALTVRLAARNGRYWRRLDETEAGTSS